MDYKKIDDSTKSRLRQVHEARMTSHWGKNWKKYLPDHWPQTDEEWRQTPFGAPWDTNVHMALYHVEMASKIAEIYGAA